MSRHTSKVDVRKGNFVATLTANIWQTERYRNVQIPENITDSVPVSIACR